MIAALGLQAVGICIVAVRWGGLLGALGVQIAPWRLARSVLGSFFFRQLLPSTVGSDAVRAYDAWRGGAPKSVALMTVLVDRLLGMMALGFFAVAALAFAPRLGASVPLMDLWVVLGAAALTIGVAALFMPPAFAADLARRAARALPGRASERAASIGAALSCFRGKYGALWPALLLSLVLQANVVLFYLVVGRAVGLPVPASAYFLIVPIATVVMMAPVSINGIGVRESIFVLLLGAYGVDAAAAVAFAWLEYAAFLAFGLLGGLVYAASGEQRRECRGRVPAAAPEPGA
jgi:hypothetical protein